MYFKNPKARLPVLKRNGRVTLLPWGRRKDQKGRLPLGCCVRLDSIVAGEWDEYFPKPVRIPLAKFSEKNVEFHAHWFSIVRGQCVQGVVMEHAKERRVYVVTILPSTNDSEYERWPRIVNA